MNTKTEQIINKILETVELENNRPIPSGVLMRKVKESLNLPDSSKNLIFKEIDILIKEKKLRELPDSQKILLGYINGMIDKTKYIEGIISINCSKDGYLKQLNENKEVIAEWFIFNSNLNGALNYDKVIINPMDKFSKNGVQNAVVYKVAERTNTYFVCNFIKNGDSYKLIPDDQKNNHKFILDSTIGLVDGYKVLVKATEFKDNIIYCGVSKIIGHINDVGVDILSIVYDHDINPFFSDEVINYSNDFKVDKNDHKDIRKNISDRNIITIDPESSKDLDDAIYLEKRGSNYFLSVSIADVSNYVPYNSILDKEAINRGTSVYLVDRVIPMLPHYLSNEICSLNPNEFRMCITCDMLIDNQGKLLEIDLFPSMIDSKKRFSYDEVNNYFNSGDKKNIELPIVKMLDECKELHKILRNKKSIEGYIDFEIDEPIIIVDEKCFPIDIKIKKRGIAQMMIEDFMVMANEAVTIKANDLKIPFIYRVHDKPSLDRLKKLSIESNKINFKISKEDFIDIKPNVMSKWIRDNENHPAKKLINKLLLRCMAKAKYSIENVGHFGLASKYYTHFTSPIRRYPDLIVHRLFWMYCFDQKSYTDKERQEFKNQLKDLCDSCSENEIKAVQTERDVNSLKFCQYMSTKIGQEFDGIVSSITSFGIFVELKNTIEGLIRMKNIDGDFYKYNEIDNTIIGTRTNRVFTFGQKIKIKVSAVDVITRQIDFVIPGLEKSIIKNIGPYNKIRSKNSNIKEVRDFKKKY